MPTADDKPLIRLGPFTGLDATTADVYIQPGMGVAASNVDITRKTSAFSTARGRANLGTFPANVTELEGLDSQHANRYVVASLANGTVQTLDIDALTIATITGCNGFTSAQQFGQALYTNAAQQIYKGPTGSVVALKWQYQVSDTPFGVSLPISQSSGGGTLTPQNYDYAFTSVVVLPGGGVQETTPIGAVPESSGTYPYIGTVSGTANTLVVSSTNTDTWTGTLADGSTWFTRVYRQSDNQPVWYLVASNYTPDHGPNFVTGLTNGSALNDIHGDPLITANIQLTLNQDPPPLTSTPAGVVFSHKDRTWVFLNNTTSTPQQCQLWYSNYGTPYSFNGAQQVQLVGQDGMTGGTFTDAPMQGVSLSSVAALFKAQTLWILYGDDANTFVVRKVGDFGCVSADSVAVCQGLAAWLTEEGVFTFDGASAPQYISEEIRLALEAIPRSDWANAEGWFSDRSYWLSFPATNVTYIFNFPSGKWWSLPYATGSVYSMPSQNAPSGMAQRLNLVIAARPNSGAVDVWQVAETDLGANVSGTWTSPISDSQTPGVEKAYETMVLNAPIQNASAQVTLTIDPGIAGPPTKTFTWTVDLSKGPTAIWEVPTDPVSGKSNTGYMAQVSVTAASTGTAPVTINSIEVYGDANRTLVPLQNGAVA